MSDELSFPPSKPSAFVSGYAEPNPQPAASPQDAVASYPPAEELITSLDEPPLTSTIEVPSSRTKTALREIAETLLLALLIFLTVKALVQNFKIEGSSMEPSLHHGQYLLVNKAVYVGLSFQGLAKLFPVLSAPEPPTLYPFGAPRRGDIIVFRYPKNPSREYIKRVVALPGETVEIRAGVVYINNQRLHEPYILEDPTYSREQTVLPEENYFVLGDNRNNSSDSHVWGPVPYENIVGKAWLTYWPWKDWGLIPDFLVAAGDG